jgi:hypothetical protein
VTSLAIDGQQIPVRLADAKLVVPIRPGEPRLRIEWNEAEPLGFRAMAPEVSLPAESANVSTAIDVPSDRWVLWAAGPLRGPAVRFWVVLACSLLAAIVLTRTPGSPLKMAEWMLLALGLTQVPLPAALVVVGWLFFLSWRGSDRFRALPPWGFNLLQVALALVSAVAARMGRPDADPADVWVAFRGVLWIASMAFGLANLPLILKNLQPEAADGTPPPRPDVTG